MRIDLYCFPLHSMQYMEQNMYKKLRSAVTSDPSCLVDAFN